MFYLKYNIYIEEVWYECKDSHGKWYLDENYLIDHRGSGVCRVDKEGDTTIQQ